VCSIHHKDLKGIIGTDQTGRFPVESGRGHKYVFILCDVDTDFIHAIPIKSRKAGELVRAFKEAYDSLTVQGFQPIIHRLDNETSEELIKTIKERGLDYEHVPPGNHRRNPAERAIQTFKSHFISILNGIDKDFPEKAWDYLIPQATMTLNMLRPCGVNPKHSAYSYLHGTFDFSAHPLAPLGCRAIVHEKSIMNGGKRGSWGTRGRVGYYVGPAMNSYRVWRFYMPETNAIVESDTASFFPEDPLPTVSIVTQIAASLDTIQTALQQPIAPHTDITESDRLDEVIARLRRMYDPPVRNNVVGARSDPTGSPVAPSTPAKSRTTSTTKQSKDSNNDAAAPRVSEGDRRQRSTINKYRPRKKQRFPTGTRVRVVEKKNGKREVFIGKAESYDPYTGIYRVAFEDGEWDEFDDDEMEYYRLVKGFTPRQPTTAANQITAVGYYPKASSAPYQQLMQLGKHYSHVLALNAGSIWDDDLHKWMAYRDLIKHPDPKIRTRWNQAGINEFARLSQGYGDTEGLDVVTFIPKDEMPSGKQATYARYVVDYRPEKDEPWRLRITCGGDKLEYFGNTTTHSASMETIKCQLNSIISTPGAKCATADISNMYLESLLKEAEFVRFRLDLIPPEFAKEYKLYDLATRDGYVYARVNKAWYGLKQAGKIAHDDLVERLAEAGYHKVGLVEGYFRHETRDIDFTLVVDDFLVKYTKDEDLQHLEAAVKKYYKFKIDTEAKQYVGINLKWDYNKRTVRLSMDGYVKQALAELEHVAASIPHHAPSRYTLPKFGERIQFAKVDMTPALSKLKITYIQRVIGKLLYYARAVDPTMLHVTHREVSRPGQVPIRDWLIYIYGSGIIIPINALLGLSV
jgi:hypothetical protein